MKTQFVKDLAAEKLVDTIFEIAGCECRDSKNGPFLHLTLRDKTGSIAAKRWSVQDLEAKAVLLMRYVRICGKVEEYRGTLQVIIDRPLRDAGPQDAADFEVLAKLPIKELRERFRRHIQSIQDRSLRALLENVFGDAQIMGRFEEAPAAASYHHAYKHGLLQHTIEVTDLADSIVAAQKTWGYAPVSRDLVIAGTLLHDIGKIEELGIENGISDYTEPGVLLGHISIGYQMILDKITQVPSFPRDLRNALLHIILSHHCKGEFGSPIPPRFPEAQIVHAADDLDAKLYMMRETIEKTNGKSVGTHNGIEGRKVYAGPLGVTNIAEKAAPMPQARNGASVSPATDMMLFEFAPEDM